MEKAQSPSPDLQPENAEIATHDATKGTSSGTSDRVEIGGPKGPEPTRYGDWEVAGRCSDF